MNADNSGADDSPRTVHIVNENGAAEVQVLIVLTEHHLLIGPTDHRERADRGGRYCSDHRLQAERAHEEIAPTHERS
jgi:hypothetical protein